MTGRKEPLRGITGVKRERNEIFLLCPQDCLLFKGNVCSAENEGNLLQGQE
jgi:hypothetical protein